MSQVTQDRKSIASPAISSLVEASGLGTQFALAKKLGCSDSLISKVKNGSQPPSPELIGDISEKFGAAGAKCAAELARLLDVHPRFSKVNVFVASPMESVEESAQRKEMLKLRPIVETIDKIAGGSEYVYWASRKFANGSADALNPSTKRFLFDVENDAVSENMALLQQTSLFVLLLYSQPTRQSSALIELGIAIGLGTPCLILTANTAQGPYMLRGIESALARHRSLGEVTIRTQPTPKKQAELLERQPALITNYLS